MALKTQVQMNQLGLTLPESYAKVTNVSFANGQVHVQVKFFVDEAARIAGLSPVLETSHVFDNPDAVDEAITLAYQALKTTEEFGNAEDC